MGGKMSSSNNNKIYTTYNRRAHHAGSWYSDDEATLDQELAGYLKEAAASDTKCTSTPKPLRGILCPHAGYSYSGPTAAYSYHYLKQELSKPDSPIQSILVLHPSHHVYLEGCAVSGAACIETPVGNLMVDETLRQEILDLNDDESLFTVMEQDVDEAEHSGEMQYPYIAKILRDVNKTTIPVLPIMCGNLSTSKEAAYGKVLAPIMARPEVLCVISTDFCHWGRRFRYQPTGDSNNALPIHEFIQQLDHQGMQHISMQEPGAFAKYLQETRNTICGRHAVQVWLNGVVATACDNNEKDALEIEFVKYAQSSPAKTLQDSSVSYASAVARRR